MRQGVNVQAAQLLYGDRYTTGADYDRIVGRNTLIADDQRRKNSDPQTAARVRALAQQFPSLSEGAMRALAAREYDIASKAGLAALDAESRAATDDPYGLESGNRPTVTNRSGATQQLIDTANAVTGWDLPGQVVDKAANNPITDWFQNTILEPGKEAASSPVGRLITAPANAIIQTAKLPISIGMASMWTGWSFTYDTVYRRAAGVRKEIDWYADQYQMNPAEKKKFAQMVDQVDQVDSGFDIDALGNGYTTILDRFMGQNPLTAEVDPNAPIDQGKLDEAFATMYNPDPNTGYKGADLGGYWKRNWYSTPLGQLATHGGWGESWVGETQENRKRIERIHAFEFDIRSVEERKADQEKQGRLLRDALQADMLTKLDPDLLFAAYGPRAGTMGRNVAEVSLRLDPDTAAYDLISGTIDAGSQLLMDPANWIPAAWYKAGFQGATRAVSKATLRTLGKVGMDVADKTPLFEASRLTRAAKAQPQWVERTATDLTEQGDNVGSALRWDEVEPGVFAPSYPDTTITFDKAPRVRVITRWTSDLDGGVHAVIADPETGKYGYEGPLNLPGRYDSITDLQRDIFGGSGNQPVYTDVTRAPSAPQGAPGQYWVDPQGNTLGWSGRAGAWLPARTPSSQVRRIGQRASVYETERFDKQTVTIRKENSRWNVYDESGAKIDALSSRRTKSSVLDSLDDEYNTAVASPAPSRTHPPRFSFTGGEISEVSSKTSPTGKQWVVRPTDVNGKPVKGEERFFPTRDEAEAHVREALWSKNTPFRRDDQFVVVDSDGNWMRSYRTRAEANDRVMQELGVDGVPQSYITVKQADDFFRFTPMGQRVVKFWTDTQSPGTIYLLSGGKIDWRTAQRLAGAKTTDDVLSIVGPRTGSVLTDPRFITGSDAAVGVGKTSIRSKVVEGYFRAQSASKVVRAVTRLGAMAPRTGTMNLNDIDEVVDQMVRMGVGLGTPYLAQPGSGKMGIVDWLDRFSEMSQSAGGRYSFFNNEGDGFYDAVIGGAMERAGVPEQITHALSRAKKRPKKSKRKAYKGQVLPSGRIATPEEEDLLQIADDFDFNRITDSRMGTGSWLVANHKDIPIFLDEAMRNFIPVPDYRAVRRQINLMGKTLRGLDEKGVQRVVAAIRKKPSEAAPFMTTYDAIGEAMRWLTSHWRNFTLMSTPYFIRNIAEEQFRMGLGGDKNMFTNPVEALSTSVMIAAGRSYASKSSRVLANAAMLGLPMLVKKMRRDLIDPKGIHMIKSDVLLDPSLNIRVPSQTATATINGRTRSQDALARSMARSGVSEPIVVAYDPSAQRWMVKDGHKRLQVWRTMPDGLRPTHIPVRIVEEKIPFRKNKKGRRAYSKESNPVPVKAVTKLVPTPNRPEPLLAVDDTLHKATPAHVFGKGSSAGELSALLEWAGDDMEALGGLSAALTYAVPYFNRRYATIVGDDWNKGYNAALEGGWADVSDIMTMAASNAAGGHHLVDEPAQRARASGIEAFARDSKDDTENYIYNLVLRQKQLSDLPHVKQLFARYPLEPDMNAYIDLWMQSNPEVLQQLRSMMIANEPPQSLRDIHRRIRQDFTSEDLDNLRNVLGAQLESAWLWGGKGADPRISEAMHTGVYKGRRIGPDNEEYVNLVRAVLSVDKRRRQFPAEISGLPKGVPSGVAPKVGDAYDRLVQWFFNTAGENRDILTASPLMRQEYTASVIQLVPHMLPGARRKVVRNLLRAGDVRLARKVERASLTADPKGGFLSVEAAHQIASRRAAGKVKSMFYDAMERRNWAVAMRVISPFAQAQVNTLAKWGELMLKNPGPSYRTMRSIDGIKSMMDITTEDMVADRWGGLNDGDEPPPVNVFAMTDEQGLDRYMMPAYGRMAKWLLGVDAAATGTIESTNLAQGGVVPAMGPAITLPASMLLQDIIGDPTWYGDVARQLWRYPLPEGTVIDRVMGSLLPGKWADGVAAALDPKNPEFVKKQAQVFSQLMNERTVGKDMADPVVAKQIIEDAKADAAHIAQNLMWLETFTKVFMPAAGALTYEPSIAIPDGDNGTVEFLANREAAAMWQKYTQGAEGQQYGEQVRKYQQDFGKYSNFPFVSITDNREAPPLTTEMQQIANDLPRTYRAYSNLWGYVMPKGDPYATVFTNPALARFREEQERAEYRKTLTFKEVVDLQMNYMYQAIMMQRLDELSKTRPWDAAGRQRIRDEAAALGYRQFLTVSDARGTIDEIDAMMGDETARDAVPGGDTIARYLSYRQTLLDQLQGQTQYGDTTSGDFASQSAVGAVAQLTRFATQLESEDESGSFTRFFETLAREEFGDNADLVEELQ